MQDITKIGAITKVGDGPWTIRVPADLRIFAGRYLWTATRTVAIDEAMLLAIRTFAAGDWPTPPDMPDLPQ